MIECFISNRSYSISSAIKGLYFRDSERTRGSHAIHMAFHFQGD